MAGRGLVADIARRCEEKRRRATGRRREMCIVLWVPVGVLHSALRTSTKYFYLSASVDTKREHANRRYFNSAGERAVHLVLTQ